VSWRTQVDGELETAFINNPVHAAMSTCSSLRPSVDISVSVESATDGQDQAGAGGARNY
jgi:ketol-acid reductoisomerase